MSGIFLACSMLIIVTAWVQVGILFSLLLWLIWALADGQYYTATYKILLLDLNNLKEVPECFKLCCRARWSDQAINWDAASQLLFWNDFEFCLLSLIHLPVFTCLSQEMLGDFSYSVWAQKTSWAASPIWHRIYASCQKYSWWHPLHHQKVHLWNGKQSSECQGKVSLLLCQCSLVSVYVQGTAKGAMLRLSLFHFRVSTVWMEPSQESKNFAKHLKMAKTWWSCLNSLHTI